jgi:glycerol-3-phosphate cytidylyltransferase
MKTGITLSACDLLHAGHLKILKEAKQHCDYLLVGLRIDPIVDCPTKNKPAQTAVERYIQ